MFVRHNLKKKISWYFRPCLKRPIVAHSGGGAGGGRTNERPGTDQVTSGPMRRLKNTPKAAHNSTTPQLHTRTWRLYDWIGPLGPIQWKGYFIIMFVLELIESLLWVFVDLMGQHFIRGISKKGTLGMLLPIQRGKILQICFLHIMPQYVSPCCGSFQWLLESLTVGGGGTGQPYWSSSLYNWKWWNLRGCTRRR